MATISITIPDAQRDRVLLAFCSQFGYQAILDDGTPNPETRPQFCKRMLAKIIKDTVISWEANEAQRIAREAAITDGETINIT